MLIIIILEVPVELAELLGENAPGLPEGLAIYLASDGREGDTYAVYSGNLKVEDGRAQFDLKMKDETVMPKKSSRLMWGCGSKIRAGSGIISSE